jgi:hypothetical protein
MSSPNETMDKHQDLEENATKPESEIVPPRSLNDSSLAQPQTPWRETPSIATDSPATSSAVSAMARPASKHGAAIGDHPQRYQDHTSDSIDLQAGAAILSSRVRQDVSDISWGILPNSGQDSSPWAEQSPRAATENPSELEIVPLRNNEECKRKTNDSQDLEHGNAEVYWVPLFVSFYSNE